MPIIKNKGTLSRGAEHGYFHERNVELIDKMRGRLHRMADAEAISIETGVEDQALLDELAALGITQDTVPVLHLLPLIEVAWADGEIQHSERVMLQQIADDSGISEGSARSFFQQLLAVRPKPELFTAGRSFAHAVLATMPEAARTQAGNDLSALALHIAAAAGGLFGVFKKVDDNEREALDRLSETLRTGHPAASDALLKTL